MKRGIFSDMKNSPSLQMQAVAAQNENSTRKVKLHRTVEKHLEKILGNDRDEIDKQQKFFFVKMENC